MRSIARSGAVGAWVGGSDAIAGLVAGKRRVLGLGLRYSAEKGEYTQDLDLGGV
ncbi:MAG: hypothetical protein IH863_00055 [Chloroflexi bacterium]|nr:hypothetical protein [Chloroflexota bacterium]